MSAAHRPISLFPGAAFRSGYDKGTGLSAGAIRPGAQAALFHWFATPGSAHIGQAGGHCDNLALLDGLGGQLLTQAGQVGDLVLAVHRLIVVQAGLPHGGAQRALVMLMNDEVGDGCLDLQGRRLGDGAAANVNLRGAVVGMGHVADLLGLG